MMLSVQASWGEALQSQELSQPGALDCCVTLDKLQAFSGPVISGGGALPLPLLSPYPPPHPKSPESGALESTFCRVSWRG